MHKIFFYLFILIQFGLAQQSTDSETYYPVRVDSIGVRGNNITQREIIIRELNFIEGDSIDYQDILYNRDRVFSLGIFNRVDLFTSKENEKQTLIIDVEESWYIYPVPFAELRDKNWSKISYGLDIYIKNFRGRNESLRFRMAFGFDPSFHINYNIPSLSNDGNYYLYNEFFFRDVKNKSKFAFDLFGKDFEQRFILYSLGLGRRFGIFHRFSINAGYNYIENPFFVPGISASEERIDRFPHVGLNYIFDTRDLAQFPTNGVYFNSAIIEKGFGINNINYQIMNVDFREYRPLVGNLFAKWRLAGRFGFGNLVPTHDYSYLGFGERIRGFYADEMEGNHFYLASAELFYPLIKELQVNLDFVPILPKELLHYRMGLYVQLFTDSGTTKMRNQKLSLNDFVTGYGGGLTLLILPYNIIRIEFALNENSLTEWILDLGISF